MVSGQISQVRRFNRLVTKRIGALDESYLARGRPLAEARVIFEAGSGTTDLMALRNRLGLDSGYLSRLLRSLEAQGLIEVRRKRDDGRAREIVLTAEGKREFEAYDRLSEEMAGSILTGLDESRRERLVVAMGEVERLVRASMLDIATEPPDSADARYCLEAYFSELAQRFDTGFDSSIGNPNEDAELAPPDGLFVIARIEGEVAGCGGLKRLDAEIGEIKRVWTAPQARGLGVASAIVTRLEAAARDLGYTTVKLDTNKTLSEAHALYARLGYRDIERYNDNPYAHRWFEKGL